jgi:hypothetical protein
VGVDLRQTFSAVLLHGGDEACPVFAVRGEHSTIAVLQQIQRFEIVDDASPFCAPLLVEPVWWVWCDTFEFRGCRHRIACAIFAAAAPV